MRTLQQLLTVSARQDLPATKTSGADEVTYIGSTILQLQKMHVIVSNSCIFIWIGRHRYFVSLQENMIRVSTLVSS